MIKRNLFKQIIALTVIFALLVNCNVPSFAKLTSPENNNDGINMYNAALLNQHREEVDVNVRPKVEAATGNPYIEAVIAEKYQEIINNLQKNISEIRQKIDSFDEPQEADTSRVTNTISESPNKRREIGATPVRLGEKEKDKKDLLNRLKSDQDGFGRMSAIEALLFKDAEDEEESQARISQLDNNAGNKPEEDVANAEGDAEFEEEYVYYLATELKKITQNGFLFHIYKIIPYIRTKNGERWKKLKNSIRADINKHIKSISGMQGVKSWVKLSDSLVQMLPYIKADITNDNYIAMLNNAHVKLSEAMGKCIDNNKCDEYINLLSKEVFLYEPGEEAKYGEQIRDGYYHGVRGALVNFGERKDNYENYNAIVLTALTNYLTLRQYDIIEDIIGTQEHAEEQLELMPISGADMLSFNTYVKAGLTLNLCRNVLTYYPDMPELTSRKGEYQGENGTRENIWWDLGEMLREEGSKEAQGILEKQINKITKKFDAMLGENTFDLGKLGILKVSALVNIRKNIDGAEEKAKGIMNTSYGDLSFEEEKVIDEALAKRYPKLKAEASLGALIIPVGEKYKKESERLINKWNFIGNGVDVVMICISVASLVVGIGKLLIKGYRLGVGLFKAIKAARMAQRSVRQIAYIRKNIKSIQYYKAWKASRRALRTSAGGTSIVPSEVTPAKPAKTPKATQTKPAAQSPKAEPTNPRRPSGNKPAQVSPGSESGVNPSEPKPTAEPKQSAKNPKKAKDAPTDKTNTKKAGSKEVTAMDPNKKLNDNLTGNFDRAISENSLAKNKVSVPKEHQGEVENILSDIEKANNNKSLSTSQREEVNAAIKYFNNLTPEQLADESLYNSAIFRENVAKLKSPMAVEHGFFIDANGGVYAGAIEDGYVPHMLSNGDKILPFNEVKQFFASAPKTDKPIFIRLDVHGEIDASGKFYFIFGDVKSGNIVKTEELVESLQALRTATGTPEVNLYSGACHSGQFLEDFAKLSAAQRKGINIFATAGSPLQVNSTSNVGLARIRGLGSIKDAQLDNLINNVIKGKGNVFARGYVEGEIFDPLQQSLKRAQSMAKYQDTELLQKLQILNDVHSTTDPKAMKFAIRVEYQGIGDWSPNIYGDAFDTECLTMDKDVVDFVVETAQQMRRGIRW